MGPVAAGQAVTLLPTPNARDHKGAWSTGSGRDLTQAVNLLPTPRARDHKGVGFGDDLPGATTRDEWGQYAAGIARWEKLTRPAPEPTDNGRLSARFAEWMIGASDGWITDILDRTPALRACGNGVVPQQAALALELL